MVTLKSLKALFEPQSTKILHKEVWFIAVTFLLSALALLLAPNLMPESYSWVANSTSESAAQAIQGAWLARLGFLLFGLAVLCLSYRLEQSWAKLVVFFHIIFATMMIATAAFSTQPWLDTLAFDPVEAALHSLTATVMGFAFNLGVFARFLQVYHKEEKRRWFDLIAVFIATLIPIMMAFMPEMDGLLQRFMFFTAYLWYLNELKGSKLI